MDCVARWRVGAEGLGKDGGGTDNAGKDDKDDIGGGCVEAIWLEKTAVAAVAEACMICNCVVGRPNAIELSGA